MAPKSRLKVRGTANQVTDDSPLGIEGLTTVGALREESRIAEEVAESFDAEQDFLKRSMDPRNVIWVTIGVPLGLYERVVADEFHRTENPLGPAWRARDTRVADRILRALRNDILGTDSREDLSLPDSAVAALLAARTLGSRADMVRCLRSPDPLRMAASLSSRPVKG
jgi:hypothetical protein